MAPVAIITQSKPHFATNLKQTVYPSLPSPGIVLPSQQRWRPTMPQTPTQRTSFAFDTMQDALTAFAAGEFLVVMDDENRENEGDLICAASLCTTEKMAWMIKMTRCV
jgi:hypothetical protein